METDEYGKGTRVKRIKIKRTGRQWGEGCCVGKIETAFSTSHSTIRALPAISLNSAPGSLDHISVAEIIWSVANATRLLINRRTSKDHTKVACVHQICIAVFSYAAWGGMK
jgi:hypothetical protein